MDEKVKAVLKIIDEAEEKRYMAGDKAALIDIIHSYAFRGEKLPEWALEAFNVAFEKWNTGKADTLDEAFEIKPRSKKQKLRLKLSSLIFNDVLKAEREGRSINQSLMLEIAEKYGTNIGYVWEFYSTLNKDDPFCPELSMNRLIGRKRR